MRTRTRALGHPAVVGLVAASALALSGCADTADDIDDATAADEAVEDLGDDGTASEDMTENDGSTGDEEPDSVEAEDGMLAEDTSNAQDVLGDPSAHVGEDVTVTGDATELLAPTAFMLEGESGEPILVVGADDAAMQVVDLESGARVQVTGTVEEDFDPALFDTGAPLDVYNDVAGDHYIQAEQVADAGTEG